MNIFKSLSQGNGQITETNLTSFLSYLLSKNNEIGNAFFMLFIQYVDSLAENMILNNVLSLNENTIREKLLKYERSYIHLAEPEHRIEYQEEKQIVDIFLKIYDNNGNDICYFLIENKIKASAININQCSRQYEVFKNSEECQANIPIYNVLLTPDSNSFETMYEESKRCNPNSIWLKWTNRNVNEGSIELCLKKLLSMETNSDIPPIELFSLFIIKSFIDFISTEFTFRERTFNYDIDGYDVIDSVEVELNNDNYSLRRYENNMIRIFDSENNLLDIQVKPRLREINNTYQLNVSLESDNHSKKNTQVLGRDIINALKLLQNRT